MDRFVRLKWVSELSEDENFLGRFAPHLNPWFSPLFFDFLDDFGRFVRLMWVSDLSEDDFFCEIPAVRHKWVSDLSEDLLY